MIFKDTSIIVHLKQRLWRVGNCYKVSHQLLLWPGALLQPHGDPHSAGHQGWPDPRILVEKREKPPRTDVMCPQEPDSGLSGGLGVEERKKNCMKSETWNAEVWTFFTLRVSCREVMETATMWKWWFFFWGHGTHNDTRVPIYHTVSLPGRGEPLTRYHWTFMQKL